MTAALAIGVATDLGGLAAALAWFCWRGRPGQRSWRGDALQVTAFGVLLGLVASVAALILTRDAFAVLRVQCHVLFCVLAPVVAWRGVALLVRPRGRGGRAVGALALLLALGGEVTYVLARRVEPFRLQIARERITSPLLEGLPAPLRVVLVADVQTEAIGAFEQDLGRAIDRERPDLLLFAGDYIQRRAGQQDGYEPAMERFRQWVTGLQHRPRLGVFAVDGDCELYPAALGDAARTLRNEVVRLETAVPVQLLGLDLAQSRRPLDRGAFRDAVAGFEGFTIVLGHAPDYMLTTIATGDGEVPAGHALLLAGHCHGGQVAIPGYGPPVRLSRIPRGLAWGELWRRGDRWLRVSRGIGVERGNAPQLRLFSPPELVVLELAAP
ncbi:MAG: metallophosphoesterase [Planctomycetota bacterium]